MKFNLKKNLRIALATLTVSTLLVPSVFANELNTKENNYKVTNTFFENNINLNDKKFEIKFESKASPSTTIFGLPQNMGPIDRTLRGVVAAGLIGAGAYGLSTKAMSPELSYTLIGVSAIPIVTGASGYCPLYQLFGVDYSF